MTSENKDAEITLFNIMPEEQRKAIAIVLSGKTPQEYVRQRPGRGGAEQNYVNTYYMTRQINLITGWRWSSEVLKEEERPVSNPTEIGAYVRVSIWNKQGEKFSHDSWGQKDVARYENVLYKRDGKKNIVLGTDKKPIVIHQAGDMISLFDDKKAAISDGIKKCLSYFGIADDIYGGKEGEFYGINEGNESDSPEDKFKKFVKSTGVSWSIVFKVLSVKDFGEIKDFSVAMNKLEEHIKGGESKQRVTDLPATDQDQALEQ